MASLRELGELRIIEILEKKLGRDPRTLLGFADDVSAIQVSTRRVLVLKTDMLVGSTDVPPGMTMRQAARKAVVANVSDLAAKGVRPLAGIVALALPPSLTRQDVQNLASGLSGAAKEYGFPLVGGDTNESEDLTISIALFAITDRRKLVPRSGARVGDIVAVTGEFGATSAGLKALLELRKKPEELGRTIYQAVFSPVAQLDLGVRLASSRAVTASIDSSDGLAWSLHELSRASKVGMQIDVIPISAAARRFARSYGYNATELALYGGEEYHLVLTVKPEKLGLARRAAHGELKEVGIVTPRSTGIRMRHAGRNILISRKGWEHFKRSA